MIGIEIWNRFKTGGNSQGVVVKEPDCYIVVSEFELQSFTFARLSLGKVWTFLFPASCGLNSSTTVLQQWWIWHYIIHEGWYVIKRRHQTKWFVDGSICLIDGTLISDTTLGKKKTENNRNEWLYIPLRYRTGYTRPDAVLSHTKDNAFFWRGGLV